MKTVSEVDEPLGFCIDAGGDVYSTLEQIDEALKSFNLELVIEKDYSSDYVGYIKKRDEE